MPAIVLCERSGWLSKPENRNYFCGAQHIHRVQEWRKKRRESGQKVPQGSRPLQEPIVSQAFDQSKESAVLALQEVIPGQAADCAAGSAVEAATALQDSM